MLELADLEVRYGEYLALQDVSLTVAPSEVVCLLGANGSGKSTLQNTVSGLVRARRGTIRFDGEAIGDLPTYRLIERGMAHVLERRRLFPYMTVLENLLVGSYIPAARAHRGASLERVYALFPRLRERRHQLAHTLSGGEQQMVAIARGLMARPRFLMLDEPFLGLAPRLVLEIAETIRRINAEGVTILFTEQNIQQSLEIADRGYILETGRLVLSGPSPDLLRNEDLKRVYMGLRSPTDVEISSHGQPT